MCRQQVVDGRAAVHGDSGSPARSESQIAVGAPRGPCVSAITASTFPCREQIKGRMWKPSRPWGLVTGYAVSGERWEDTVVREAREETGYEVKVEPGPVRLVTGFKLRAEVAFLAEFVGGTYRPDPKEVLDAQFFELDALPDGLLPQHRDLIDQHRHWFMKGDDVDRTHAERAPDRINPPEARDL